MKVSKSYQSWKYNEAEAFEKNGKLYVAAEAPCPRCSGKGIIIARVENGQPIPIPVDGDICYQCLGRKVITKDIRLYTDKEYEQKEAAAERARLKKQKEYEEKIRAEAEMKRAKWLDENGFDASSLVTYIYFPQDSYNIKDTLKQDGFRFNHPLLWHAPSIPVGYEDKVIEVKLSDVAESTAFGYYNWINGAVDVIKDAIERALPAETSEWVEQPGSRIKDYPVTLSFVRGIETKYGYSQVVCFEDSYHNKLKWFTSVNVSNYSIGDSLLLSGTVKDHIVDKYMNEAEVTLLTRCSLKKYNKFT